MPNILSIALRKIAGNLWRKFSKVVVFASRKLNGDFVDGFVVTANGLKFMVAHDDLSVGRSLRTKGDYGSDELKRIFHLVTDKSSVIFLGAHVGALAIPTAKKVESSILIEANPKTFRFLMANVFLNNLKNVECHNVAVGEMFGEISFVTNTMNSGGSKREPVLKKNYYYYDNPETILVPMRTLDDVCLEHKKEFDLVFVDIEGSEIFALQGMNEVLKRTKVLMIEFIPHHIRNVAGCSIDDFIRPLITNFDFCYAPSSNTYLRSREYHDFFVNMYRLDQVDDVLIFSKHHIDFS